MADPIGWIRESALLAADEATAQEDRVAYAEEEVVIVRGPQAAEGEDVGAACL